MSAQASRVRPRPRAELDEKGEGGGRAAPGQRPGPVAMPGGRYKRQRQSVEREYRLQLPHATWGGRDPCCKGKKCCRKRAFTAEHVLYLRQAYVAASSQQDFIERRQRQVQPRGGGARPRRSRKYFIESEVVAARLTSLQPNEPIPTLEVGMTEVCSTYFCWVYGLSKNKLYRRGDASLHPSMRLPRQRESLKADSIIRWFTEFKRYYQLSPTEVDTYT
jgi:hypothetical protein